MNAGRPLALVALAVVLAACAGAPPAEAPASKTLESYAADPFVPVNLYLNANESALGQHAQLIEHAARRLKESGAFVRVDRGVQRWPITIQASYRLTTEETSRNAGRRLLSVVTFGLVPVRITRVHQLFAEIFEEPESVAALELSVTAGDRVSLYDLADGSRDERATVESLLERLLAEIAQRKLIPRWKTFKPAEPKKKAPEGRPT